MVYSFHAAARIAFAVAVMGASSSALSAQTDYYNTDRGRPVQIEDAYPTERHAFELKIAPVRLERARASAYTWTAEPEIAYGILPRTQVELGIPVVHADVAGARTSGLAGLDLSALHNFNVETETLPALAVRADVLAPVGRLAPDHAYTSLTGVLTRTLAAMRVHANGQVTIGPAAGANGEVSRWLAGVAADKTWPLKSLLLTAELYARGPLQSSEDVELNAGTGVRYQWSPTLALDAGVGRRFTGAAPAWYVTVGTAHAFALPSLIPGGAR